MKFINFLIFIWYHLVFVMANSSNDDRNFLVGKKQIPYATQELSDIQFFHLSQLSNVSHLREATKNILIPRVVGTPGHKQVREYIIKSLTDLQWHIELDSFYNATPIMGTLQFHNIIAKLNPNAKRYLVLACHYDSKYMGDMKFLGATDSAVPCAMLLNLALVLHSALEIFRESNLSLMLLFFDGEEAFEKWSPTDSIYGARHLAKKWNSQGFLPKIDILMLLDLLGASDPKFYSFFQNTESWYTRLINIEKRLFNNGLLEHYASSGVTRYEPDSYFQPRSLRSYVEDDHIPFLERGVPTLHLIPMPFPIVWHTADDNKNIIDFSTTENLSRIIRIFTMEYLYGTLNK